MSRGATAARVVVRGLVQGVWYRGWAIDQAQKHGLRGWVRNRKDRSVEALFIGPAAEVEAMVKACRRGPPLARVDAVERFEAADDGSDGFRELPTV